MSYEIAYERQFIKVPMSNGEEPWIIPLVLHGSNNCTEISRYGKERRARNWSAMYFNGSNQMPLIPANRIMDKVKGMLNGTEDSWHFKWRNESLNDTQFVKFFENGLKGAKTMEELQELSAHRIYLHAYISKWTKDDKNIILGRRSLYTSKDIWDFLSFAKQEILNRGDTSLYVCIGFPDDKPILVPVARPQSESNIKTGPYWVLKDPRGYYVMKLTARKLGYCTSPQNAKHFNTDKAAIKWFNEKIQGKFSSNLIPEQHEYK